jgi:hypothetical protein
VFIGEILANMTQVSDVAPGPLVCFASLTYQPAKEKNKQEKITKSMQIN